MLDRRSRRRHAGAPDTRIDIDQHIQRPRNHSSESRDVRRIIDNDSQIPDAIVQRAQAR
jgi:hypothetical protein